MATNAIYFGKNETYYQQLCNNSVFALRQESTTRRKWEVPKGTRLVFLHVSGNLANQIYMLQRMRRLITNMPVKIIVIGSMPNLRNYLQHGADEAFCESTPVYRVINRARFLVNIERIDTSAVSETILNYKLSIWKRVFDVSFASVLLILLSPLFLLVSVLIRLESKGQVFYSSKRVGAGYRVFDFYKFRSMYMDADQRIADLMEKNQYQTEGMELVEGSDLKSSPVDSTQLLHDAGEIEEIVHLEKKKRKKKSAFFKLFNDPRITNVGRFIRNTSIDELPQLINVIKGDMSIVGNRPLPLYEAEKLTCDQWSKRFLAPAGLTGLWQVSQRAKTEEMSADERKQLDIQYAEKNSFFSDLGILVKTIPAMIQHESV